MDSKQIMIIVGIIVVCLIVVKLIKGFVKFVLLASLIVGGVFLYKGASPEQIDTFKAFAQNGIQVTQDIKNLATNSKTVRMSDEGKLQVTIGQDNWVNVNDIGSIKKVDANSYAITVGSTSFTVKDQDILKVLDLVKTQGVPKK